MSAHRTSAHHTSAHHTSAHHTSAHHTSAHHTSEHHTGEHRSGEHRTDGDQPVLVACAHGTRSAAGRRAVALLRLQVAALRQGLEVVAANVDVQRPALPDVVARLTGAGRRCVVVPLLLSAGYHVRVDISGAVGRSGGLTVATRALGPDPVLADLLADRLAEAGRSGDDAVVLAAAGSRDPRAVRDVEDAAVRLADRLAVPVTVGYVSAGTPRVEAAVAAARGAGAARVALACYLLAPGHFVDRLSAVGADLVSGPLAPDPRLAALVLARYDSAVHDSTVHDSTVHDSVREGARGGGVSETPPPRAPGRRSSAPTSTADHRFGQSLKFGP